MKLSNNKYFAIEMNDTKFNYEIICDEIELMVNAKINIEQAVNKFKDALGNTSTDGMYLFQLKKSIIDLCISTIETFLGEGAHAKIVSDIESLGKSYLTVSEYVNIMVEILDCVEVKRVSDLKEEIDEELNYD